MENYPGNTASIQIVDGKRDGGKMASVVDFITICLFLTRFVRDVFSPWFDAAH